MPPSRPITDPERIRALAHPVRLELLEHLGDVEEATATESASAVGESVASCSFHLRMLAKYGYIEPAPRRGREKPWRLAERGHDLRPSPEVSGSLRAVAELASLTVTREADRLQRFYAGADAEPDEWIQATTLTSGSTWLTAAEAARVSRALQEALAEFPARTADPASRPARSRRFRVLGSLAPETPWDRDPDGGAAASTGDEKRSR